MQRFFAFIQRDATHVFANVISLVVVVGMVVVPSFYAWFNIAGSWDPYGNTKNLKVAVANSDAGYTGDLIPITLNMGERMTSSLTESTSIGYTVTTEEQAIEGVQSGEYYAAIVFPADFTTNMMSVLSSSPTKPKVRPGEPYRNGREHPQLRKHPRLDDGASGQRHVGRERLRFRDGRRW